MEPLTVTQRIWRSMERAGGPAPVRVTAWDGTTWGPGDAPAELVLRHPGSLRAMLWPPGDLSAGEAYIYGDYDIEGDIYALLHWAAGVADSGSWLDRLRLVRLILSLPDERRSPDSRAQRPTLMGRRHTVGRDRQAVSYHYDTGNDFFELFLDASMVYSCAYFLDPEEPLDVAQRRKIDVVCRKLQLSPGQRLLDVGCGWGALVVHAAETYGVHATGITLSREQASAARDLARRRGVEDRVDILEVDYREIEGTTFDAIASVGMVEHVGRARLGEYFASLRRLLAPGGIVLNHGIVTRDRDVKYRRDSFIRTYVFPDGELRPLEEWFPIAESEGLEVRDVEALRAGYALTLRRWVANLEANRSQAIRLAGERAFRIWRLYMAGSAVAFERADIGVYQVLLADERRPWTFGRSSLLSHDDRRATISDGPTPPEVRWAIPENREKRVQERQGRPIPPT